MSERREQRRDKRGDHLPPSLVINIPLPENAEYL